MEPLEMVVWLNGLRVGQVGLSASKAAPKSFMVDHHCPCYSILGLSRPLYIYIPTIPLYIRQFLGTFHFPVFHFPVSEPSFHAAESKAAGCECGHTANFACC